MEIKAIPPEETFQTLYGTLEVALNPQC
jgi:hypothetical protein